MRLPSGEAMPRLLVVEDQDRVAKALSVLLELHGMSSVVARSPSAALACLDAGGFDGVLQDMNFSPGTTGGEEGMALFGEIRARNPELPVVALTAWSHLAQAVELVRAGAADYVEKPWDDDRLVASVRRALQAAGRGSRTPAPVETDLAGRYDLRGLVYASAALHDVVSLVARVASADVSVLIHGESGTGKELLAEILHANSPRRHRPFVRLDVGALPETLLEAELFGAEPGAYTGAPSRRRVGRFETADGGTLLLDEIGNLGPAGQAKLLRVLQTGEFERLGSSQTVAVDVRIVAATNADLQQAIHAGTFREDLYYRLAVIEIEVPPLRRRREDVVPLAESFLAESAAAGPRTPPRLGAEARRALVEHDWPGNVRELRNRIQRAVLLARGQEIEPADLGLGGAAPRGPGPQSGSSDEAAERQRIEAVLIEAGGVVSRAAETMGLSRQALYRRMERLGIVLERRPRS
jgi:DNA-binding NtrC family response regulator